MSFTELFRRSTLPRPTLDSLTCFSENDPVQIRQSTRLHAGLIRRAIADGKELCIVSPTSKVEDLHILALDVLWSLTGECRDIVFVLSSDTGVREHFRKLRPPTGVDIRYEPFSEAETTIANVTPEGKLSSVTESFARDTYPRFLFSYTSKRLPSDIIGERVACVLFDDSVKVTDERLEKIRSWRERNEVPTIVYFTSDPLSDLYETIESEAEVWTWPMELLRESIEADHRQRRGLTSSGHTALRSEDEGRIAKQLQNRVDGVEVEIHAPGGEEVEELFGGIQTERYNFEKLVYELDSDPLWNARSSIRYAIRELEELLAPIELTEIHSSGRSISARLKQLERYTSTISSDPQGGPAVGTYRDVLSALEELREKWPDISDGEKKEGHLITHLMAIADSGESVAVVTSSETNAQAVATHLQSDYSSLYSELGDDLSIYGPDSVRKAKPSDHTLLYGAPRYNQRDLLRLSISPHLVVFAYPTELGLLRSQVESLNAAFDRSTELSNWDLARSATTLVCGERVSSPTPEYVDVSVPEPEDLGQSELASGVQLKAEGKMADLADIVRTFDPDFRSPDRDPVGVSTDRSPSKEEMSHSECVVLFVEGGGKLYYRPSDEVSILRGEHKTILTKEAEAVSPGDVVLHFEDTDDMREKLYELIRDRGDAQLAFYAASWRVFLEQAIEEHGDDLDRFIERVNEHLDRSEYKTKQTYRRWYNLEVKRTRSKKSMKAIAAAYDLTFVQENFDTVWNAVHTMENLYQKLKEALAEHAYRSLTTGEYEDIRVSEHPRIQLSDFDIERHLHRCVISEIELREVPTHRIGTYDR